MRVLVTGSSGHLGEGLVRSLRETSADVVGLDRAPSPWTDVVGTVTDVGLVREVMTGVDAVLHTATLHKPQMAFSPRQAFVDTNVTGTLTLLDAAADAGVGAFVMSSSTTVYGDALIPPPGAPAAWIDEAIAPVPKNIYGVTKSAAEDLCELAHRNQGLACIVLRASRFFSEADDAPDEHEGRADANVKANEYASRRLALDDVIDVHLLAASHAPRLGFARYVVSATTPFTRDDLAELRFDAASVFARRAPSAASVWADRGWTFPSRLDRTYVNAAARRDLGWQPRFDLEAIADLVSATGSITTPWAATVGSKPYAGSGYHRGVYQP